MVLLYKGAMSFIPELSIYFQIANQKQVGDPNFKGLSQVGRRTDFSEIVTGKDMVNSETWFTSVTE
jgi:hypothetical protein